MAARAPQAALPDLLAHISAREETRLSGRALAGLAARRALLAGRVSPRGAVAAEGMQVMEAVEAAQGVTPIVLSHLGSWWSGLVSPLSSLVAVLAAHEAIMVT